MFYYKYGLLLFFNCTFSCPTLWGFSVKPPGKAGILTCLNATVGKPYKTFHSRKCQLSSVERRRQNRYGHWTLHPKLDEFKLHSVENAIPEWLGWIPENSNPISDVDHLREEWWIPCAGCEQALARCPVLLLRCAEAKLFQSRFHLCWPASAASNFSGSGCRHFTVAAVARRT